MEMEMYVDGDGKKEKKRMLTAGRALLWVVMIGIACFLASQSLVMAG